MPRLRIQAHYEQLSKFERGRIIGMKNAGSANRRITRQIGRRMRPLEATGKNGWTMADFSVMMVAVDLRTRQIGNDASHFQLYPENHRGHTWRHLGYRAYPAFTIACDTGPQPGVMVWRAISFDSRTRLGVITGTLTAQPYVDDIILRTVLIPFLLQYPGRIFSEIMPDHIRHVLL
ncbi:transposable element Tc1 transposase [Trichonephila clavipes]|nr:transposable element Tc1 transposase [Trichonephila clavipes]